MITLKKIKENSTVKAYINQADSNLKAIGFTEHCFAHSSIVAERARDILEKLNYNKRTVELAEIACYLHDIGNLVSRVDHAHYGGLLAINILNDIGMDSQEIALIASAIGNHDEATGAPVNAISAALILADKSDMRTSRVRNLNKMAFDIHDRVNYSVEQSSLEVSEDKKEIVLSLKLNTEVSSVMEYFEIFTDRMLFCKKSAQFLGTKFSFIINDQKLL